LRHDSRIPNGLFYLRHFVSPRERADILAWIQTLHPIWEQRFSTRRPPPEGEAQRWLLRPVYWLGNWQFACLDYYHPPKGTLHRCVRAEPYPPALAGVVQRIETFVRKMYKGRDLPPKWAANTCLINFYGDKIENGKRTDTARVGEHKDFELGPVASLSFGERAFFQFVESKARGTRERVVFEQWLVDSSLQVFGTPRWKDQTFHRVQRVERKQKTHFNIGVPNFETRRINFTFRYVPEEHIVRLKDLPKEKWLDVEAYVRQLADHSPYFEKEITAGTTKQPNRPSG